MPCYSPLVGFFAKEANPTGKRSIVFSKQESFSGIPIRIPCGECIGCRLRERGSWAIRCYHEKLMHHANSFVTLTYGDAHLPYRGSLVKADLQLFMRRLRLVRPPGMKFFACGEYGDRFGRPHYHALLFGCDFPDMRQYKVSDKGHNLYRSAELSLLWPFGNADVAMVDLQSISYVCGYVAKKVGQSPVRSDGREPEFRLMSRRPGLGSAWFDRFGGDAYRHDHVIVAGQKAPLCRYYDTKYDVVNPIHLKELKVLRKSALDPVEQSRDRMAVRELLELRKREFFRRGEGDG